MITIKQQIEEQLPKDIAESNKKLAIDLSTEFRRKLPLKFSGTQFDELQFIYTLLLLVKYLTSHVVAHYIRHNKIDPLDIDQTKQISELFLIECTNAIYNGILETKPIDFDNPPIYK